VHLELTGCCEPEEQKFPIQEMPATLMGKYMRNKTKI
jgi:hypothetical protein